MNPNVNYIVHSSTHSVHNLGLTVHSITHYTIKDSSEYIHRLSTSTWLSQVLSSLQVVMSKFCLNFSSTHGATCRTHLILRNQISVTTFMLWQSLWSSWLCDVILTFNFAAKKTTKMRSYAENPPSWNSCQRDSSFLSVFVTGICVLSNM
jgi:hypothetical protein